MAGPVSQRPQADDWPRHIHHKEDERRQGDKPNRRTLQRHLHKLIEARRLTTEGKASPCSTNRPLAPFLTPVQRQQ
jgi:hypothetical protein